MSDSLNFDNTFQSSVLFSLHIYSLFTPWDLQRRSVPQFRHNPQSMEGGGRGLISAWPSGKFCTVNRSSKIYQVMTLFGLSFFELET